MRGFVLRLRPRCRFMTLTVFCFEESMPGLKWPFRGVKGHGPDFSEARSQNQALKCQISMKWRGVCDLKMTWNILRWKVHFPLSCLLVSWSKRFLADCAFKFKFWFYSQVWNLKWFLKQLGYHKNLQNMSFPPKMCRFLHIKIHLMSHFTHVWAQTIRGVHGSFCFRWTPETPPD